MNPNPSIVGAPYLALRYPLLLSCALLGPAVSTLFAQNAEPSVPEARLRGPQPAERVPFLRDSGRPESPAIQIPTRDALEGWNRRDEAPASARTVAPSAPPALARRALAAAPSEVLFAVEPDGEVWVKGRSYKASFGAHGASYVPFLGSDAPRTFP